VEKKGAVNGHSPPKKNKKKQKKNKKKQKKTKKTKKGRGDVYGHSPQGPVEP
jgi:hypothetical protein